MVSNKFLRGLLNKCGKPVASNNRYEDFDFLDVLLDASQRNGFIEGTCKSVFGGCDGETLLDRFSVLNPHQLVEVFREDVYCNVRAVKLMSRNRKMVLAADVTCEAYYGKHFNEWVHRQVFHKGATGCYKFLVLYVLVGDRREIVGVLPLRVGDDVNQLLLEMLDGLKGRLHIECLLLDKGFDSGTLIYELKHRGRRFLMLWRQAECHRQVFAGMGRKKWLRRRHTLPLCEGEVSFTLVYVKGIKIEGDEKAYNWVFATNMRENQPKKYILQYRKRWGIETLFRVLDGLQIKTKTTNMNKRFFLVLFTVYLYNTWKECLCTIEFHVTFSEYTTHLQDILQEIHPRRPPTKRQQQARKQIKTALGLA